MKIGSDQQAAFRIVMRIADMDINETEIGIALISIIPSYISGKRFL